MKALLEFLKLDYADKKVTVVHGSYHYTSEFIFASTDWLIKQKNFADTQSDIILAGHCGLPFFQQKNNKHWLNSGVIGMPANEGTPRVWYMVLSDNKEQFSYEHLPLNYNFNLAAQLMTQEHLPAAYAQTLISGIWDNCEILPLFEEAQQGELLEF